MKERAENRAGASTQGGGRDGRGHTLLGDGVGVRPGGWDAAISFGLPLLVLPSSSPPPGGGDAVLHPRQPGEERPAHQEYGEYRSAGRGGGPPDPGGSPVTWRLWYRRPGVLASRSDDGNVRVSVATVWPAAPLVCPVAEDATAPAGMNFLLSAQTLHSFSSPSTNIQSAYCLRWAGYLSGVVLNSGGRVSIPEIPEGLENTQLPP